jgi:Mrp family chromosome partitioning ATPase
MFGEIVWMQMRVLHKRKFRMSENCNHECSSCGSDCGERTASRTDFREKAHEGSSIGKVIAVASGKGGVGKSLVTSLLAVMMKRAGYRTAVLDADITGPSIPKAFGIRERVTGSENGMFPVTSTGGIPVMSLNLLLENETDPVVWRGPIIAGTVKQFWTDVIWGDVDYLFIDMPPGTGDVPLTVFQSLPVDGVVIVASPQELVSMIVEKAVGMAGMMHVPVVGLVENMSYVACPDCGKKIELFGPSHIDEVARKNGVKTVCRLPVDPALASACDNGTIEQFSGDWLEPMTKMLAAL